MRHLPLATVGLFPLLSLVLITTAAAWPRPNAPTASGNVSAISAGYYHTCALKDGGVWCWGSNAFGELGDGTTMDSSEPVAVSGLGIGVSAISAGNLHTCALKDGGVWCWGANASGMIGSGRTTNSTVPVAVTGLESGVSAISAGGVHACAVKDGGAWCWGNNFYGQLGNGTTIDSSVPVAVSGKSSGVSAISAGFNHTCALSIEGAWCWGANLFGQLGIGTKTGPEICSVQYNLSCSNVPLAVSSLGSGVEAISAGGQHTCALKDSGAWCWGWGAIGQLGNGARTDSSVPVSVSGLGIGVSAISAGATRTCALNIGGTVWCWGNNLYGELGNGIFGGHHRTTTSGVPVAVIGLGGGVLAISAGGGYHTCALKGSEAWCWGNNAYGQLGNGTNSGPQQCPVPYSVPCSSVPLAVVWPGNRSPTPTPTPTASSNGTPKPSPLPTANVGVATAVSAGLNHTCVLTTAGGVKCWGRNSYGQLGDGTTTQRTTPVDVSGLTSGVEAIIAGFDHTCALTTAGGVKCWGSNASGQLGGGTATGPEVCGGPPDQAQCSTTPVDVSGLGRGVIAVSAGFLHTCALTNTLGVKCWGANHAGQLGDGTTTGPQQCSSQSFGSFACSTVPVDVSGLGSGVIAVTAGNLHTCAVTDAGGVRCWGDNFFGQLGDGSTTGPGECSGDACSTTPVDVSGLGTGVTAVSAGTGQTCARTTPGGLVCWGKNSDGQLGSGPPTGPQQCSRGGGAITFGCSSTPVDVSSLASGIAAISAGFGHTCALTTMGGVKCWGRNDGAQLGLGQACSNTICTTPADVSGLSSGVAAVSAGGNHTCALISNGGVKCWGWNSHGQLGLGTSTGPQQCSSQFGSFACSTTPVDVPGLGGSTIPTPVIPSNGDANCDGKLTISDATFLLAGLWVAAPDRLVKPCNDGGAQIAGRPTREDANCDGVVDVFDVLAILKALAGFAQLPTSCT